MSTRQVKAQLQVLGDNVRLELGESVSYIELTPDQARQLGGALFFKAADALGQPRPTIITLSGQEN